MCLKRVFIIALMLLSANLLAQTNLGPIMNTTQDNIGQASAPPNPTIGNCRAYFNSTSGQMTYINSSGGSCGGGGGGGGGTVNSGTINCSTYYAATGTTVSGQCALTWAGSNAGFSANITGAGSVSSTSDGVHAGSIQLSGNTTQPALASNSFSLIGPPSASFTAFGWYTPTAENASAGLVHVGAASSHLSALTVSGVAIADLTATGTPSSSTFLRGDNTWSAATGAGCTLGATVNNGIVFLDGSGNCTSNADLKFVDSGTQAQVLVGSSGGKDGLITLRPASGNTTNIAIPQSVTGDSTWFTASGTGGGLSIGTSSTGGNAGIASGNAIAPQAITAISVTSNVVTVTFTQGFNVVIPANTWILVAGVSNSSFNGTFKVQSAGNGTLTYNKTLANTSSSGGTVSFYAENSFSSTAGASGSVKHNTTIIGNGGNSAQSDGSFVPAVSILATGNSFTGATGGDILIMGGWTTDSGVDTTEPAGNVTIAGGSAVGGVNTGGSINLNPGARSGTGKNGVIYLGGPTTFATLPTCAAGTESSIRAVSDSTVSTWGSTIAGSGTNHVLAYCDGTNWTVMAN